MFEHLQSWMTPACMASAGVGLIVIYVIKSCFLGHPSGMPPMPGIPLPILGHALSAKPTFQDAMMRWRKTIGENFTCYFGPYRIMVVGDSQLAHEAFMKNVFSDRPVDLKIGLVLHNGEKWTEERNLTIGILKDLGRGDNPMEKAITEEIYAFTDLAKSQGDQPIKICDVSTKIYTNIIFRILAGCRSDYDDPFFLHFLRKKDQLFHDMDQRTLLTLFPILEHLPGDLFKHNKLREAKADLIQCFCSHFINKFKDNLDDKDSDNFIKAYLRDVKERKNSGGGGQLDVENFEHTLFDLLMAGTDTTRLTSLWILVYLINFPDVQKKIHTELDDVVGRECPPTWNDKPKLNYLNAFILEAQRYCCLTPTGEMHMTSQEARLGPYTVPANTLIMHHMEGIHFDEKLWKEPQAFRPERFLNDAHQVVTPSHLVPFSMGRRRCPGDNMARIELFYFTAIICQQFEILPENPDKPPSMNKNYITFAVPDDFSIRLKPRTAN